MNRLQKADADSFHRELRFPCPLNKDLGKNICDKNMQLLESGDFTSMSYQDRVVWLREDMTKEFYLTLVPEIDWDDTQAVPQRYLNPQAFETSLRVLSLTTRICETTHRTSRIR